MYVDVEKITNNYFKGIIYINDSVMSIRTDSLEKLSQYISRIKKEDILYIDNRGFGKSMEDSLKKLRVEYVTLNHSTVNLINI